MNKLKLSDDDTVLEVWTKDVDSVYRLIGEAEGGGLHLEVESKRSWLDTKLIAQVSVSDDDVSATNLARFKSLVRRIQHIGSAEAA